jgi:hypothetical protein
VGVEDGELDPVAGYPVDDPIEEPVPEPVVKLVVLVVGLDTRRELLGEARVERLGLVEPLGTRKVGSDDPDALGVSIGEVDPLAGEPEPDEPPAPPFGSANRPPMGRADEGVSFRLAEGSDSKSFDCRAALSFRIAGRGRALSCDSGAAIRGACGVGSVTALRWIRDSSVGSQ